MHSFFESKLRLICLFKGHHCCLPLLCLPLASIVARPYTPAASPGQKAWQGRMVSAALRTKQIQCCRDRRVECHVAAAAAMQFA